MVFSARRNWILIGIALLGSLNQAHSQVERQGGGASSQLNQQYQQAVAARTALQAENAKLKKDLEDAMAKLGAATKQAESLKGSSGGTQKALAAAEKQLRDNEQALESTRGRLQELLGRFRELTASMAGVETDRSQIKQQLADSLVKYDVCAEQNFELYEISGEVLDRLEHQGIFSAIAQSEPFTRIKRTRIENLVDDYRARAEELRLHRKGTGASPIVDAGK